jgi:hypothetical protein
VVSNALRSTSVAAFIVVCGSVYAQTSTLAPVDTSIEQIMKAVKSSGGDAEGLSIVRESILRESATLIGARQGLRDKSCAIRAEIELKRSALDRKYRFGDLMMGRGIFPPVISEARNSVSLEATVMRVASRVYHLDEAARVVDVPPTWRDWLYVGLSTEPCDATLGTSLSNQTKPQNAQEETFFRSVLQRGYSQGEKQAADVLEANLARLERAYAGMRRYYDLYARGMVSAPVVITSTDIVKRDDPNTLVVGNTLIRITVPSNFVEATGRWIPLAE